MVFSNFSAGRMLADLREKRPLVHNITNSVVTNFTANVLLAFGASPVMTNAKEEVEEMVRLAGALVLNIGTLTVSQVEAMLLAGKAANAAGVPVVFDPVGAGATKMRTNTASRILREIKVDILRGNLGEVAVLTGTGGEVKGVDTGGSVEEPEVVARQAAEKFGLVAAVTGPTDYVSDGRRLAVIENGHFLLSRITGTGCSCSALCGALAAVTDDLWEAATAALAYFGLAGEIAAQSNSGNIGPGSFQTALLDALYCLKKEDTQFFKVSTC